MATTYRIFPSIGIARLGQDRDYFIGPEIPGRRASELDGSEVQRLKDGTRTKIRKQAARFHLFQSDDGTTWTRANFPAGALVTWSVTLCNKKAAIARPPEPPIKPTRPQVPPANNNMVIDGGTVSVSGRKAAAARLAGKFSVTTAAGPFQADVELGEASTDGDGNLIVLGGNGISGAPANTPLGASFYHNPNWYDDVSDGPVTAEIDLGGGAAKIKAEGGAWVVVAPPDFAPEISGVVTLYDVLRQAGIDMGDLPKPAKFSFDGDIAPILQRVRRLQWVHDDATWQSSVLTEPDLRSTDGAHKATRQGAKDVVMHVEEVFEGHENPNGPPFRLRAIQRDALNAWVDGNIDVTPQQPPAAISATGLTQAALEATVGQGFYPGIEAGIILLDPSLYVRPFDFRINHQQCAAGDITALMAQPWQADFLKCHTTWWPSQRPDIAAQSGVPWVRGANGHKLLVERFARLGFVVRQGADEVFVEAERDPNLPIA
jgi:hypothetical protein